MGIMDKRQAIYDIERCMLFIISSVITIRQINKQKIYWWVCIFWLVMMAKQAVEYAEMMAFE